MLMLMPKSFVSRPNPNPQPQFTAQGWTDLPDQRSGWSWRATAVSRDSGVDEIPSRIALAWALACLKAAAVSLVTNTDRPAQAIGLGPVSVPGFLFALLPMLRRRDTTITLEIDPHRLRVSGLKHQPSAVVMDSENADSLVATPSSFDRHRRRIGMYDTAGRLAASFTAGMATVVAVESISRDDPPIELPTRVPVSVLIGSWWPHQTRRTFIVDRLWRPVVWRYPDLSHY